MFKYFQKIVYIQTSANNDNKTCASKFNLQKLLWTISFPSIESIQQQNSASAYSSIKLSTLARTHTHTYPRSDMFFFQLVETVGLNFHIDNGASNVPEPQNGRTVARRGISSGQWQRPCPNRRPMQRHDGARAIRQYIIYPSNAMQNYALVDAWRYSEVRYGVGKSGHHYWHGFSSKANNSLVGECIANCEK